MIQSGAVRYHDALEPLLVDIDSVQRHHRNYNRGDVEAITESILTNGMYRPIFTEASTGEIIAGNHTWEACKGLGAEKIPVIPLEADAVASIKIMIADNRTAAMAMPDDWQLISLLSELQLNDNLVGTGYRDSDLEILKHLEAINDEPLDFAQWPTITVQVPPHVKKAYYNMTREAGDDRERFELVLRLAGWDGSRA